jgi:hypothetical protein
MDHHRHFGYITKLTKTKKTLVLPPTRKTALFLFFSFIIIIIIIFFFLGLEEPTT